MGLKLLLNFDLICLGTGPAASIVATTCAKHGLKVAIVESREFGGTCALRGCNPKKVFTNAAALVDQFRRARGSLTRGDDARIEWSDLVAFQHEFTDPVRERTEDKLRKLGIETFHGAARFEGERVIRAGENSLSAGNIFVGVGARPVPLTIPGGDLVVTSDDFMELDVLPSRILFLGGGFISFEFAHVAACVGSTVTIVDRHELPLKSFDPDLVRMLIKSSDAAGVEFLPRSEPLSIERRGGEMLVTLKTAEGVKFVTADLVVNGSGRMPNLQGMDLELGQIAQGKRGISVNEYLQSTTNRAVYAAGDCADTGVQMLTSTASAAARIAAANILASHQAKPRDSTRTNATNQGKQQIDFGPVPQVVFSIPPLAAVGLSETEARQQGFDVDVRLEDLSTKGEVRKLFGAAAGCKVIIDRQTDRFLGVHILGPHADEVINLFSLAIRFHLTTAELKSTLFSYPTMTAEYCRML